MIDVYLRSAMFHLPIAHEELVQQVTEKFYENRVLVNSSVAKLYPIQNIEGNENIIVKKQNTNIFLLNFLLLVMYELDTEIEDESFYSDSFIIESLEALTQLDLSNGYDDLEEKLLNYLAVDKEEEVEEVEEDPKKIAAQKEKDRKEALKNISFSMDWVKEAHKKLK